MAISITTLNNNAAVAKTFVEVAKDKVSSDWVNTTDAATVDQRLLIKQSIIGRTPAGVPIRRTLVQTQMQVPYTVVDGLGRSKAAMETVTCNFTFTRATTPTTITATNGYDVLAFLKNFLTTANLDSLVRGEV